MAIPALPDYTGFTFKFSREHPNWYIGVYANGGDGNTIGNFKIVTFDKNTLTEQAQYNKVYSNQWHKPWDGLVDNDDVLWIAHGGYALESYSIDSSTGTISKIQTINEAVGSASEDYEAVAANDSYIACAVRIRGVRIYQRTGVGTINNSPVYVYGDNNSNKWGYVYINHDSNLLYAREYVNNTEVFIDMDTITVVSKSHGGDADTAYMEPIDDTHYGDQPYLKWTRGGVEGYNYIYTDKSIEQIENYDPNNHSQLEEEIYNSGSILTWWAMDSDSTTKQLDRSGNKIDLTCFSINENQASIIPTETKSCVRFPLTSGASAQSPFNSYSNSTMELWVKLLDTANGSVMLLGQNINNGGMDYVVYSSTDKILFRLWSLSEAAWKDISLRFPHNYSNLYHLVAVREASNVYKFYVNGVLVDSVTITDSWGGDGVYINYDDQYRNDGDFYIQHVVRYTKALTHEEIIAHYESGIGQSMYTPLDTRYVQRVLQDNPIALWQLNEQSGKFAYDVSGNNNHCGYYESYGVNTPLLGESTPDFPYDEVTDYSTGFHDAAKAENHVIDQTIWNSQASIELWFKIDQFIGTWGRLISIGEERTQEAILVARNNNTNELAIDAYSYYVGSFLTPVLGKWYHLVVTKNGSSLRVYVDGNLTLDTTINTTISLNRILIGDGYNDASPSQSENMNNHIAGVALYDYVLNESKIKAHYRAGLHRTSYHDVVLQHNPVALVPCYDLTGSTKLVDITENANDFEISGVQLEQVGVDSEKCVYLDAGWARTFNNIIPANTEKFAVEAWIKTSQTGGQNNYRDIFRFDNTTHDSTYILHKKLDENFYALGYYENSFSGWEYNYKMYGDMFELDKWHHVVMQVDTITNMIELYVNGKYYAKRKWNNLRIPSELMFYMGIGVGTNTYPSYYYYQNIAIYTKNLTPEEILGNYRAQISAPNPVPESELSRLIIEQEPVCYWKLGETSGTVIHDTMGNAHGTIVNGSADTMNSAGLNLSNPTETALTFNGTDQYITIDGNNKLPYLHTDKYTIEFLVMFDGATMGSEVSCVSNREAGNMAMVKLASNELKFYVYVTNDGYLSTNAKKSVKQNTLYHVVGTFDGYGKRLYVNGEYIGVDTTNNNIEYVTSTKEVGFIIGAEPDAVNGIIRFFAGKLAHVAIYDKVLDGNTIKEHFRAAIGKGIENRDVYETFILNRSPKAFWKMDDDISKTGLVYDSIGENHFYAPSGIRYNQPPITSDNTPCVKASVSGSNYLYNTESDINLSGNLSVEAWIVHDGNDFFIFDSGGIGEDVSTNIAFRVRISSNVIYLLHETGAGDNWSTSVSIPHDYNKPTHICLTRNTSEQKYYVYLNGEFIWSGTYPTPLDSTTDNIYCFKDAGNDTSITHGNNEISHLALYERVLTPDEIKESYLVGKLYSYISQEIINIPMDVIPAVEEITSTQCITVGTQSLVDDQHGTPSSATSFGSDGYTKVPESAFSTRIDTTQPFGFNMWVYLPSQLNQYRTIITSDENTNGSKKFWVGTEDVDNTNMLIEFGGTSYTITGIIPLGEWFMLTISRNTSDVYTYINGVQVDVTTNAAPDITSNAVIELGGSSNGSWFLEGTLSDFKWFDYFVDDNIAKGLYELNYTKYRIYGTVLEDDVPVERMVRIYDRKTGNMLKELNSFGGTFETWIYSMASGNRFFVVAFDDDNVPLLEAMVHDRVEAEV